MSWRRPGSSSFTYTAAVMCIAETSTIPSRTPLARTIARTRSVMLTNSCAFFVSNQRYSVAVVIAVHRTGGQVYLGRAPVVHPRPHRVPAPTGPYLPPERGGRAERRRAASLLCGRLGTQSGRRGPRSTHLRSLPRSSPRHLRGLRRTRCLRRRVRPPRSARRLGDLHAPRGAPRPLGFRPHVRQDSEERSTKGRRHPRPGTARSDPTLPRRVGGLLAGGR